MNSRGVPNVASAAGFLLAVLGAAFPPAADAAFNVGAFLRYVTPAAEAQCTAGGTSLAVVQGSRLSGVDSVMHPAVLVISCPGSANLYFIAPSNVGSVTAGTVLKTITTIAPAIAPAIGAPLAPASGWTHLVNRPDRGDLLGCGSDGRVYSIDYTQNSQNNTTPDGTATLLATRSGCSGLAWDADEDMIYQGVTGGIAKFQDATPSATLATFGLPSPPPSSPSCTPSGLAITGGVLVVACQNLNTIYRLNKTDGTTLVPNGMLSSLSEGSNPGLSDLACDPSTFASQFKDTMWSRHVASSGVINRVVALEFPAFTCGLPSNATVLSAGLQAPACFGADGQVVDSDGDGLPDCWEDGTLWAADGTRAMSPNLTGQPGIDFDGDGVRDLVLCVPVDTNGDGVTDATECANKDRKDVFVEIDWMQNHKPDPTALSQAQSVASVGVKSVREAFLAAPVSNPSTTFPTGIAIHFHVDEQVSFWTLAALASNPSPTVPKVSHVNEIALRPCTGPPGNAISQSDAADFDAIKKLNFGTFAERTSANNANTLNAKRLVFRYVLFAHKQIGSSPQAGSGSSGCAEVAGDDAIVTLGAFTTTIVAGVIHPRGTTDQQAGTFMHELGHTFGLRHGGGDGINCKPNYLSVMSYSRQFTGSPINNRRLDYSRALLPGLNESVLNENFGLGTSATVRDTSLGPISPYFPAADQTAFGGASTPSSWTVAAANAAPINWNRSLTLAGPTYQTNASANINIGPGGCDGEGPSLVGYNDWANLLYRFTAAIDSIGGTRTDTPLEELTNEQEAGLFLAADTDGKGGADAFDCGPFTCVDHPHRIDIKPSFPLPKVVSLGTEANVTIAIFSEKSGNLKWDASTQVVKDSSLTFTVQSRVFPVKVNSKGQGTCSVSDVEDPETGKDNVKDLKCQFPTSGMPFGTHEGVISGFFMQGGERRAFRARQAFTVLP